MPCHRLSLGALFLVLAAALAGIALTTGSAALVAQRASVAPGLPPAGAVGLTLRPSPASDARPT